MSILMIGTGILGSTSVLIYKGFPIGNDFLNDILSGFALICAVVVLSSLIISRLIVIFTVND